MRRSIPPAELIAKAYQLAYVVLGDEEAAFDVAKRAAHGWELEFTAQRDRRRYRLDPAGFRQKLIMNEELALQFLTFKLCERIEKLQEAAGLAGRGPMPHESYFVFRYLKYLLYKTVQFRSFHVVVGLCRLAYEFSKRETTQIYELLVQDLRLRKDDQMYKDWKLLLLRALDEKRFSGLLSIEEGAQGAKRFRRHADQYPLAELARRALTLFSPWGTSCELPPKFDARRYHFSLFKFEGRNPDMESHVEERRMSAVINPDTFSRLLQSLGLGDPADRAALPVFNLPDNGSVIPPPDFDNLPELSPAEWMQLVDYLNEGKRKRGKKANALSIEIEGAERATLNLDESRHAVLSLGEEDDLVQVFAKGADGSLLLGSLLLSAAGVAGNGRPWRGRVKCGRGRCISIKISPAAEHPFTTDGARLDLYYTEGGILGELLRRVALSAPSVPVLHRLAHGFRYAYLWALAAVIAAPLLLWNFLADRRPAPEDMQTVNVVPTAAPMPQGSPPSPSPSPPPPHEAERAGSQSPSQGARVRRPQTGELAGRPRGSNGQRESGGNKGASRAASTGRPLRRGTGRPPGAVERAGSTGPMENANRRSERPGAEGGSAARGEVTRGGNTARRGLSLKQVKTIFVEPPDGAGANLRGALVNGLTTGGELVVVTEPGRLNEVDAVFRWSVKRSGARREVFAHLVNRPGEELWSETLIVFVNDEQRLSEEVARKLIDSLLKARRAP